MKTLFGWLMAACLLAACGSPDEGPEIRNFEPLTKKETDEPFSVAPSSKSPATMTVKSGNDKVATVDGMLVTITGAGTTTLTASQPATGSFGPTEKTVALTVTAVACEAGKVRIAGECVNIATCVSPAALNAATNQCVVPASSAKSVKVDALTYMGVTSALAWDKAEEFCSRSVIDGQSGWRLPTAAELKALHTSGLYAGQSWLLENTWTATPYTATTGAAHATLNLATGAAGFQADTGFAYVTCVR